MFIAEAGNISFCTHLARRLPAARHFCTHPLFQDLCHDLLGPDVRLYWDQAVYKRPERPRAFPWHQDEASGGLRRVPQNAPDRQFPVLRGGRPFPELLQPWRRPADSGGMRVAMLLALVLLLGGCFAFDEIDDNMKEWDHLHAPAPEEPESAAGARGVRSDPGSAWWQQARSVTAGEADADLVRCRLPEGESFMRRTDCESRGGRPR